MNSRFNQARWSGIFAANLVVPLYCAAMVVSGMGWIGVFLAVAVYRLAGIAACRKNLRITRSLIHGGAIVALLQLFPILQIWAGMFALDVVSRGSNYGLPEPVTGAFGAFVATTITGGSLLTVASVIGLPRALVLQRGPVVDEAKPLGRLPIFDEVAKPCGKSPINDEEIDS